MGINKNGINNGRVSINIIIMLELILVIIFKIFLIINRIINDIVIIGFINILVEIIWCFNLYFKGLFGRYSDGFDIFFIFFNKFF